MNLLFRLIPLRGRGFCGSPLAAKRVTFFSIDLPCNIGAAQRKEDLKCTMGGMGNRAAQARNGIDCAGEAGLPAGPARPVLLTVAGFDPSSGAGLTADLQTFWNHQLHGVSAITALTVQSARGVTAVEPVAGDLVRRTLDRLAADVPLSGVKIGMLANAELVGEVVAFLRKAGIDRDRVVLDPVIRSSSGAELLESAGVARLRSELLPLAGWVTPNTDEVAALTGNVAAPGRNEVPEMARALAQSVPGLNLVVTGGHLDPPDDYLRMANGREMWFAGKRVEARGIHGSHGTGCVFSSALLCRLVLGDAPEDAVRAAKSWVVARLDPRG
jgi:hydroxymethylpyrimidine/phosphomethylpyrimidine kinase